MLLCTMYMYIKYLENGFKKVGVIEAKSLSLSLIGILTITIALHVLTHAILTGNDMDMIYFVSVKSR